MIQFIMKNLKTSSIFGLICIIALGCLDLNEAAAAGNYSSPETRGYIEGGDGNLHSVNSDYEVRLKSGMSRGDAAIWNKRMESANAMGLAGDARDYYGRFGHGKWTKLGKYLSQAQLSAALRGLAVVGVVAGLVSESGVAQASTVLVKHLDSPIGLEGSNVGSQSDMDRVLAEPKTSSAAR